MQESVLSILHILLVICVSFAHAGLLTIKPSDTQASVNQLTLDLPSTGNKDSSNIHKLFEKRSGLENIENSDNTDLPYYLRRVAPSSQFGYRIGGQKRPSYFFSKSRRAFHPWSGKKRSIHLSDSEQLKRDSELVQPGEKRAFSAWSGKRSDELVEPGEKRSFSAWSGKRSDVEVVEPEEKRTFSAWSGKRSHELPEEEKRTFTPWSGKRSPWGARQGMTDAEKRKFDPWSGKRSHEEEKRRFDSWAGKRGDDEGEGEAEKRAFSAWSGKRAGEKRQQQAVLDEYLKRKFTPWSGKRDMEAVADRVRRTSEVQNIRRRFNPWNGKRSVELVHPRTDYALSDYDNALMDYLMHHQPNLQSQALHNYFPEKRGFEPWSGKRAFQPWGGKRGFQPWGGKRNFQPWTGKRSIRDEYESLESLDSPLDALDEYMAKRQSFNPWGGKRSIR